MKPLVALFKEAAAKNKKVAESLQEYVTFITDEDIEFLEQLADTPKKINLHLARARESLKGKMEGF